MSTDGGGLLNALGYVVALLAIVRGLEPTVPDVGRVLRRPPWAALGLWACVAIPSLVQLGWPALLRTGRRDPDLIRDHHEYWRLLTSAFLQDGGVPGTVFNLVVLYLVACLAVRVWNGPAAVAVFVAGALAFDVAATWAFDAAGAGNSGATFILAAAVLGSVAGRTRGRAPLLACVVVLAVGAALATAQDAHGLAFLTGLLGGAVVAVATRPGQRNPPVSGGFTGGLRWRWNSSGERGIHRVELDSRTVQHPEERGIPPESGWSVISWFVFSVEHSPLLTGIRMTPLACEVKVKF